MRLRIDDGARLLKLTHPRSVRPSSALAWAATHKRWVEQQLCSLLPRQPLVPGASIPIAGEDVELSWRDGAERTPQLCGGRLTCGGSEASFPHRIELFLKRLALETLSSETAEIADGAGIRATRVSIGDARSRWGSCSSNGRIRYSWRLILAEPEVRRFVVAHEVAHLVHLDHGPEFKALERELFDGDVERAKALLRAAGPRLRRIDLAR